MSDKGLTSMQYKNSNNPDVFKVKCECVPPDCKPLPWGRSLLMVWWISFWMLFFSIMLQKELILVFLWAAALGERESQADFYFYWLPFSPNLPFASHLPYLCHYLLNPFFYIYTLLKTYSYFQKEASSHNHQWQTSALRPMWKAMVIKTMKADVMKFQFDAVATHSLY